MNYRVLVVEDDESIVASLEFLMRKQGHDTRVARDGPVALEAFSTFSPHLVILDVMLPSMDGYEICREMCAKSVSEGLARPRIILLTAKGAKGDAARGMDAGADEYITKPFSTRDLTQRVRELLMTSREGVGAHDV